MKIDWKKTKCAVCNNIGFHPETRIQENDATKKQKNIRHMVCNSCGDDAFSPEQLTASKHK